MKRLRRAAVALSSTALVLAAPATPVTAHVPTSFEVTIRNISESQPLTPPVIGVHRRLHVFRVGTAASFELKEIAENGNLSPMVDALESDPNVINVETGTEPIVPASRVEATGFSDEATFSVSAGSGARFLSWASMLICTNDGFTGVDAVRLPRPGRSVTFAAAGYDAGTELNTEDFADLVPPCQGLMGVSSGEPGTGMSNPALAEGGVIEHHPGIQGGADLLPEVHGWTDPVALITITAM